MMKYFLQIICLFLFSNLHIANASVIEIPDEYYYSDDTTGLDWVWVSSVNIKEWSGFIDGDYVTNLICEPSEVYDSSIEACIANDDGWRFATSEELDSLFLLVDNFYDSILDDYINAAQYWNSELTSSVDSSDFDLGQISSEFSSTSPLYETFYVRGTVIEVSEPHVLVLTFLASVLLWNRRKPVNNA